MQAADGPVWFRMPVGESDDAMTMLRFLSSNSGWDVADHEVRGRAALKIVGEGLGRVSFRPGLLTSRAVAELDRDLLLVAFEEAEALMRLVIERHNAGLLDGEGCETPDVTARGRDVDALLMRATT